MCGFPIAPYLTGHTISSPRPDVSAPSRFCRILGCLLACRSKGSESNTCLLSPPLILVLLGLLCPRQSGCGCGSTGRPTCQLVVALKYLTRFPLKPHQNLHIALSKHRPSTSYGHSPGVFFFFFHYELHF